MTPPYYVYAIRCKDNSIYVGLTDNFIEELCKHRQGLIQKTQNKLPVYTARLERYDNIHEAKFRKQILEAEFKENLL